MPSKYEDIDFKPPQSVADAAAKGLEYRAKASPSNKGGLTPSEASKEGIGSGVSRATTLKNRKNVSPDTIKQMVSFFARHNKNKSVSPEHKSEPWNDKGYVSWLLWGGDPGKVWAEKVKGQMDKADSRQKTAKSNAKFIELPAHFHPVLVQPPKAKRDEFPFEGYIDFQGIKIDVENVKGSTRSGKGPEGEWSIHMNCHYGEIRNTEGVDGDKLDVYVGDNHDSSLVVVIHQHNPWDGQYDEDKVMLGFDSVEEAIGAYKKQYDRPGFFKEGQFTAMPIGSFWRWVCDRGNKGKRVKLARKVASMVLASSNFTRGLKEALKPYCHGCDPETLEDAVDTIRDVVEETLARDLRGVYSGLKVVKFSGSNSDQNGRTYDDGSTYWYSVSYPSKVELRAGAVVSLHAMWGGVQSALRELKLPDLKDIGLRTAFLDMVKFSVEGALPRRPEYLSNDLEDMILTEMGRRHLYEEEVSSADENGDEYNEASNLEIDWNFEPVGESASIDLQGDKLQVWAKLDCEIRVRRISIPGDYKYGRWAAQKVVRAYLAERKDLVPGGIGDKTRVKDVDPKQLAKGVRVEKEHTRNRDLAREIALDHLTEMGDYYTRLEKVEKKASSVQVTKVDHSFGEEDEFHYTRVSVVLAFDSSKEMSDRDLVSWVKKNWDDVELKARNVRTPPPAPGKKPVYDTGNEGEDEWNTYRRHPRKGLGWATAQDSNPNYADSITVTKKSKNQAEVEVLFSLS